ncbi:MAG: HAMP domain-containing sensor histidine kinase [Balneolaceae bacterium]|nr:HAMP domain-containing sensor histidine kinase [Balneolaceae bacterium]
MNAVSGYLDLMNDALEEDGDLSRILDYHRMIQSGINDISDMLNQLNEIAKIEKGLVSLHFTKVDLCWLIEETCDLLRPIAQKEDRRLVYDAPEYPVYAEVDFVKLKRVVYNLISNGIKYTGVGGRVAVSVENGGDMARVVVDDNGIGISEDDKEAIFEPFVKLNSSGKDGLTSSGLGLFISSYFTRQMHGKISVDSVEGQGSTFMVSLPLAEGFQQSVSA